MKARVCAKGLMRRFPQRGKKKKKNQNKATSPREEALPAPEQRGAEGCSPFPSPPVAPEGRQQAGTRPPRWKSFAWVYVQKFAWHAAPQRAAPAAARARAPAFLAPTPRRAVAGPAPKGWEKPPAPRRAPRRAARRDGLRGAGGVSQAHETGSQRGRDGSPRHWVPTCPDSAPSLNSVPVCSGFPPQPLLR